MKKYRSLLIFSLLILLSLLLLGCNSTSTNDVGDNSPNSYLTNGAIGSAFDTTGMPTFSNSPGIYYDSLVVSLSCDNPEYTIRYTTDGSTPTAVSPAYTAPFTMQATVSTSNASVTVYNIRAASFDKSGKMIGRTVSGSFLFPSSSMRFTTKVISIVTDPNNLYKEDYGLIAYPYGRGREWERPVNFQLFDTNGKLTVSQDLGMRVNGTGSRSNAQKNFRLYARKDYTLETGHVNYPLLPGLLSEYTNAQIEEFDTFLVRGGASNFQNTMLTTMIAFEMMEGSAVDAANFEPAALFLNGQYYGLMTIAEDYSPYYFESHYGVDEEKITTLNYTVLVSGGLGWEEDDCTPEEGREWSAARHFVEDNDMSDPELYRRACEIFDMQNLIEYLVFECYVNNWDWPRNNVRVWRYNGAAGESASGLEGTGGYDPNAAYGFDGRWRYVAKDLDIALGTKNNGYVSTNDVNFFEVLYKDGRASSLSTMFHSLMDNEDFRLAFFRYLCEFMSTRGSTETLLEIIDRLALQIAPEMKYHGETYGQTLSNWDQHITRLRDFAKARPGIVLDNVNNATYSKAHEYEYTISTAEMTIGEGGKVSLYDTDMTGTRKVYLLKKCDQTIYIIPDPGYRVDSVQVTGGTYSKENDTLYLRADNAKVSITFVKDDSANSEATPIVAPLLNEIGYADIDRVNGSDWIELYNPSSEDLNLSGYSIVVGNQTHTLSSIVIPAGGFKVIFFSGTSEGGVYAPFTLSDGESVSLFSPEGKLLDSVLLLTSGKNTHLGRFPDGKEWAMISFYDLTPNTANIFRAEAEHYYASQIQNTIMLNGNILNPLQVEINEQGQLTTTLGKLLLTPDLQTNEINRLRILFTGKKEDEKIILEEWYSTLSPKSQTYVFYIEALNTYVIRAGR